VRNLGRRIQMQAFVAAGSGDFGQDLAAEPGAEFFGLPRTAARYWLLQFEDGELRFTHRAAAERWASKLAERGKPWQLTWHDEDTPEDTQAA
jgi:hypothetical protein